MAELKFLLQCAATMSAFAAAVLWLKASTMPTPPEIKVITISDTAFGGELPELFNSVARQKQVEWPSGHCRVRIRIQLQYPALSVFWIKQLSMLLVARRQVCAKQGG